MTLQKTKTPKSRRFRLLCIAALIAAGIGAWYRFVPLGMHAQAQAPAQLKPAFTTNPAWPQNVSAAAIGAEGYGVLAKTGDTKPRPIASIAKVITALAILEKHPLKLGEQGPLIPITEKDEQLYRDYVAQNGTVVLVKAGVPISLRQALQAILMTSANNVSDTTAAWAFGSLDKYIRYANDMLKRHGLHDTVVGGDASGLDPATKSTPSDLIKLGELALKNPVLAEIVAMTSADMPVAGPIPNYNGVVTKHGYTGIKPGDSIQAGITLLFSTKYQIKGKPVTLIGVILGADSYRQINDSAVNLMDSFKADIDKL